MIIGSIHAATKSVATLIGQTKPQAPDALECFQHIFYHRRTYTSGTTRSLTFFNATGDPDVTNMDAAQALADPQFFEIWGVHFSVLHAVTNTPEGVTGVIDNINQLVKTSGTGALPTFKITIGSKDYPDTPLMVAYDLGGVLGNGWGMDNVAAGGTPSQTQFANNGLLGGGFNYRGSLTIPPKQKFKVTVAWPAAVTLTGGDQQVMFALSGVLHRDVK